MPVIHVIYWASLGLLYYIYDGYLRVLQILAIFHRETQNSTGPDSKLKVTVLITVHNEAHQIREKIANVLETDFPAGRLEVLVASDGSTDGTDDLVTGYEDGRVKLFRRRARGGKTATQNDAIRQVKGDIVVFTDAATRFDAAFLHEICSPFSDPVIGAVDGHLLFKQDMNSDLSASQGFYWNYELKLRRLESRLGILAIASGACLAVRHALLLEMDPSIGEDCIVPLDVAFLGGRVVHAEQAQAFDRMDISPKREFRTRVRMTARNWTGTWARPELLNPLWHPGYALALWSHKLLRWLSPFFIVLMFLSALVLGLLFGGWQWLYMIIPGGILSGGTVGWAMERGRLRVPVLGTLYSFGLANLGFLFGVLKAWFGKPILTYK